MDSNRGFIYSEANKKKCRVRLVTKKIRLLNNSTIGFVELQGFEPWSEHGSCQAFYMFSQS